MIVIKKLIYKQEFHETCHFGTFYFTEKLIFRYQQKEHFTKYDWGGYRPIIFGKMQFLPTSENQFFHEIKRDGITSLHGIHDEITIIVQQEHLL